MATIYILELEGGKYYVGKSDFAEGRIQAHWNGKGSSWTRLHRPIKVYGTYPTTDAFDEDTHTYRMMDMFGEDNVRGGSYCAVVLSHADRKNIRAKIASANDACLKCFEKGHFTSNCTATRDKYGDRIPGTAVAPSACIKCLCDGHTADKCIAKCDKNGVMIPLDQQYTSASVAVTAPVAASVGDPFISRKRSLEPTSVSAQLCTASRQKLGSQSIATISVPSPKPSAAAASTCYRCGRDNHWEVKCYASTDINGKRLPDKTPSIGSSIFTSTSAAKAAPCCARCGRENHSTGRCYAVTHVNGKNLSK
jgi:hypothetical protein